MVSPKLFTPLTLGGKKDPIHLHHRVVMAPMSRLRTGREGIPTELTATYYAQRSTPGGLIISEGTSIGISGRGYFGAPGIYNQEQIDGWRTVTTAVHKKKGVVFLQVCHVGRKGHPLFEVDGALPVSSSTNMPLNDARVTVTSQGLKPLVMPRALDAEEVPAICRQHRIAAEHALAAGFDGIELHAANGFLIEQFLFDSINDRTDQYGGPVENRARLLFEILDAMLESVDSSKIGVRLSPYDITANQVDSDPIATYTFVFEKLNDYDLAYVHLIEPRGHHYPNDRAPKEGVAAFFRKVYKGVLLDCSDFTRSSAIAITESGDADLVAIGRDFISNPDLVTRFELDAPLSPYDEATFYSAGPKGYTDYPAMEEVQGGVTNLNLLS